MDLKAVLRFVFRCQAHTIRINLLYLIYVSYQIHDPGPGARFYAQIEGNLSFEPIVRFFIFSFSRLRLYCPGPGLWVWLKMEIDLQSSRPCPMVMPDLGLFWKSEARVYLSGEGTGLFLNRWLDTVQYRSYHHNRMREPACSTSKAYRSKENYSNTSITCPTRKGGEIFGTLGNWTWLWLWNYWEGIYWRALLFTSGFRISTWFF